MNVYSLTDEKPYTGTSYYRLKQTDYDGRFEYSDIVVVELMGAESQTIKIYSNPVTDKLEYSIDASVNGSVKMEILNVLGKKVITLPITNLRITNLV